MDTHRVDVLYRADNNRVIGRVAHQFEFVFLPTEYRLFKQNLACRTFVKSVLDHSAQFCLVMGEAGTETSHRERRSNHHGIAGPGNKCERSVNRVHDNALCDISTTLDHQVLENLPVFTTLNRLEFGSNQFDVVLRQDSLFVKCHCGVQRGLTTERRQNRIRSFLGDDRFDCRRRDRLNVRRIREIGIGHDGRRIRIDENDADSLFAKHAAGLSARIVELGRLPNHDRP
ncbi:unannotated protein [freshwater metagenome]|uniref:Unannotated protein n=1 Tax=freshwater metagenome TaxID=449393 RepID=A0A6J6IAX2_9ZZZZ